MARDREQLEHTQRSRYKKPTWWHVLVLPVLKRYRKEDQKFKVILGYEASLDYMRFCLRNEAKPPNGPDPSKEASLSGVLFTIPLSITLLCLCVIKS